MLAHSHRRRARGIVTQSLDRGISIWCCSFFPLQALDYCTASGSGTAIWLRGAHCPFSPTQGVFSPLHLTVEILHYPGSSWAPYRPPEAASSQAAVLPLTRQKGLIPPPLVPATLCCSSWKLAGYKLHEDRNFCLFYKLQNSQRLEWCLEYSRHPINTCGIEALSFLPYK